MGNRPGVQLVRLASFFLILSVLAVTRTAELPSIVDEFGRPFPSAVERSREQSAERRRGMMAKIDAAQTTDENRKHWANADSFSADAAYDNATRFNLRNRGRYEGVNNGYAKASIRSSGEDLIGTGPRLQLQFDGDEDGTRAKSVERPFARWMEVTKFAKALRIAEFSKNRDGGSFGIFDTNENQRHPVKLYVRWVEAEMCASPFRKATDPFSSDGIKFDGNGLPVEYSFLVHHPGNTSAIGLSPLKTYTVPAEFVVHWYSQDRFGQHHGIPEITSALPLYSQLRRYTLATLTAAEFAAMLAGVMTSDAPASEDNVTRVDNWEMFEMVRGALLTLPAGHKAEQFESKNPSTGYGEFKREVLNESGRSNSQPLNVVTGNSSGYNYSSGRLDHVPYHRHLRIQRFDVKLEILDPVLYAYEREARLTGTIGSDIPPIEEWQWCWNWDGFDSIDQNKDASADNSRLGDGTSTYAEVLSEYGQDWREVFEQRAREESYAKKLGLTLAAAQQAPKAAPDPNDPEGDGAQPTNGHNRLNGQHRRNGSVHHG